MTDQRAGSAKGAVARRLCDDDGMVSRALVEPQPWGDEFLTYLGLHNRLAAHTGHGPVTEEFSCTGSAHLAGELIRCTSPAHAEKPRPTSEPSLVHVQGSGLLYTPASTGGTWSIAPELRP